MCAALAACSTGIQTASAPVTFANNPPSIVPAVRANAAAPRIQAIWISGKAFHGGDLVRMRVIASTNVAVVEMRTFGYGRALHKRDFGQFSGVFHVPLLPPFVRVHYAIHFRFIARNSAGNAVEETAAIAVR
ncbi:MAG: hypothetical protein ACREM6_04015 [Vulcanimicrobiaceae bacterium]